jgi:hypothetical protein
MTYLHQLRQVPLRSDLSESVPFVDLPMIWDKRDMILSQI